MSNKNSLTKNSQYVESLVSFILDTKPYHSKLTEISEEYQFDDSMTVTLSERMSSKAKLSAVWPFSFFSSGDSNNRILQAQRLTKPVFNSPNKNQDKRNPGQFKAFRDEVTDFGITPIKIGQPSNNVVPTSPPIRRDQTFFAYDKKAFDGPGVNDAFVERKGNPKLAEPLLEGHDFFQSHGAFRFQVSQLYTASGKYAPLFTSHNDARLIREATLKTREVSLDKSNPNASINIIRNVLDQVRIDVGTVGRDDLREEIEKLFTTLNKPDLPASYTKLTNLLLDYGVYSKEKTEEVIKKLKSASSPLFFGKYTDLGYRESGELQYGETDDEFIRIYDFEIDSERGDYEEWTLTAIAEGTEIYRVEGSLTGRVGYIKAGESYANLKVKFKTQSKGIPYYGYVASIKPKNKIIIHPSAKLESWAIVKVNPLAYSRPFFASYRYGHIVNKDGVLGQISILDQTYPNKRFEFVCNEDGQTFDMTSPDEPSFYRLITVGKTYNDGVLHFTIKEGTEQGFTVGERFYVEIINDPPYIEDLDLSYGYDLDSYDDQTITYNNSDKPLYFGYASRFPTFNVDSFNVKISQKSIDGRKWRARALPSTQYINEVQALKLPNEARPNNLKFFYADRFSIEWSDDDFQTFNVVQEILPEQEFIYEAEGISFSIPYADKPYIAARSDDSLNGEPGDEVIGGDMMTFTVRNPPPRMDPIGLSSNKIPRLIMHGDSYYETPEGSWSVQMTSENAFQVINKKQKIQVENTGMSFNRHGVHFTVVTGKKGLKAGETFTFKTFERKPSFLVHGSVSGWTGEAEIGRYFTNGSISFKIDAPRADLFTAPQFVMAEGTEDVKVRRLPNNLWKFGAGQVQLTRIRPDQTSTSLIFDRSKTGYKITDADTGTVGFVAFDSTFEGKMFSLKITDPQVPQFKIQITAHDFALWTGHNAVILRPKEGPRWPTSSDFIRLEKTQASKLKVSIRSSTDISDLLPESIDQRFIDLDTNSSTPLSIHSPETLIFNGWLPTTQVEYDTGSSIADFSDPVRRTVFKSAASGETIGEMKPSQVNLNEKVIFEWDKSFIEKYLSLNSEANLVVYNTGWNDTVKVNFSETFRHLFGSGLLEDQDLKDVVSVKVTDEPFFKISIGDAKNGSQPLSDRAFVRIDDNGFNGFVPGYDNMPFDAEELSQLASQIDIQTSNDIKDLLNDLEIKLNDPNLTLEEKALLRQQVYMQRDSIIRDALDTMLALYEQEDLGMYDASSPAPTFNGFGIPMKGLGIDVNENPTSLASTSINEIITFDSLNFGNGLSTRPYGVGKIDEWSDETFVINITSGSTIDFTNLAYEEYETQLETKGARTFEINLQRDYEPDVYIWFPEDAQPYKVPTLTRLGKNRFTFSIPSSSPAKLAIV